jgi:ABC-type nitrate/sulfonate/bicarbonate transport system permease component
MDARHRFQVLASMRRIAIGFTLSAAVAIPAACSSA